MNDSFAHMRPYREDEVPGAIDFLLEAMDWNAQLSPFLGEEASKELIGKMKSINSVDRFQGELSKVFIDLVLDRTATDVTLSFADNFQGEGALFISNHRDIVLDPSLINRALLSQGVPTTQIGIGSNLLRTEWVEKLVRLNKSFIVQRGGSLREQFLSSAEVAAYVREVIVNEHASVWLAHREGRAKDGNDRTSPALMRMLLNGEEGDSWNRLQLQPVSLSYEWDPCDGMKVRELLMRERNEGEYVKERGEDERSMKQGLFGWKGGIHVEFCEPIYWEDPPEGIRPAVHLADRVDDRIHRSMKNWPAQHWAAQRWMEISDGASNITWPEGWEPDSVGTETQNKCRERLALIGEMIVDSEVSQADIEKKWCEITMTPLLNRVLAERAAVLL